MFTRCKRPVIVYGGGVRGAEKEAREFAERAGVPVLLTWRGLDLIPSDHPLVVGSFGTHAPRYGNFAIQKADLILVVGARMDTRTTGHPPSLFAPNARIVMVDIDKGEIDKLGRAEAIVEDAKTFLSRPVESGDFSEWRNTIARWKTKYPVAIGEGLDPYSVIRRLSDLAEPGDVVVTDTGCAFAWTAQTWEWKEGQRFIHAFNQTPMGYGLPGAIGAHYATGKRVLLIAGDGSLMMSIGELATVAGHKLPIKILLINNQGHAMVRQTQREWLGAKYPSTSIEGGLTFPDFVKVAQAHGIPASRMGDRDVKAIHWLLGQEGPGFLDVPVDPDCDVVPKAKFGLPIHDQLPLLSREELTEELNAAVGV